VEKGDEVGRFDGKIALVTGAGSGIGKATATRLAGEGAKVCAVDMNEAAAKQVASDLGGIAIAVDVGDSAAVDAAFAQCHRELGGLDIAYLNAGITTGESAIDLLSDDQYERIMRVNVDGVVYGLRAAARLMTEGGGGSIVATASLAGLIAFAIDPIYTLTKHAVVGLVRSVAAQLEPRGITVNAICPGMVKTPLMGEDAAARLEEAGFPLLAPEDIANAVVTAITDGSTGECWACQPGREPLKFHFGQVPGPRTPGKEGMRPPGM
jgi:NAD(P)-dependent dehydrogenase (short-subunit alcohol dehydrogenase family)